MNTVQYAAEIVKELQRSVALISEEKAQEFADRIRNARKVFVAGAGRSGLMGKAFAMRLMHMGIDAYVIGETITPGIGPDDLLIVGSGSGETQSLVAMARKAKQLGALVGAVFIRPESSLAGLSDFGVEVPAATKDQTQDQAVTIQPMGSLFEQTLLILYDAVILKLMQQTDQDSGQMFGNHANLE